MQNIFRNRRATIAWFSIALFCFTAAGILEAVYPSERCSSGGGSTAYAFQYERETRRFGWPISFFHFSQRKASVRVPDPNTGQPLTFAPENLTPAVAALVKKNSPELLDPNSTYYVLGPARTFRMMALPLCGDAAVWLLSGLIALALWNASDTHSLRQAAYFIAIWIACGQLIGASQLLRLHRSYRVFMRDGSGLTSRMQMGEASSPPRWTSTGKPNAPYDVVWGNTTTGYLGWPRNFAITTRNVSGFCSIDANGLATENSPNSMSLQTKDYLLASTFFQKINTIRCAPAPAIAAIAKAIDSTPFTRGMDFPGHGFQLELLRRRIRNKPIVLAGNWHLYMFNLGRLAEQEESRPRFSCDSGR